jgi:glycosyltransferase involved in cell wall biosynthesis
VSLRILLVISEVPPVKSGISRVAGSLKAGLEARGHTVDTLSTDDVPRKQWGEIRLSSMSLRLPGMSERLRSYDVINVHGPVPTFSDVFMMWEGWVRTRSRPKLVYTYLCPVDLRGFPWSVLTRSYGLVMDRLAQLADHVIVSTPSYERRLAAFVPEEKLSVIPWGVDYDRFYAPVDKPGPFTVLYFGQIRPYKGLPVLLDAAAGLAKTRLWIIGDGHYAETCRRKASDLGLSDVTFWGSLPDKEAADLMKQAHVMVLPSISNSEAFGIALLEGMSAGLVPVASHLPGVVDVVGTEGFTFPPGDAAALIGILTQLQRDSALRSGVATLAQRKAQHYSWDRTTLAIEHVFTELVGNRVPEPIYGRVGSPRVAA